MEPRRGELRAEPRDKREAPPAFPPRARETSQTALAFFALGALLVGSFYLALKAYALHAYGGDEHIYLYQAKLIADGFAPYADFFMAHPPFQALLTAGVFGVFGYDFELARLLPVIVTLAGALGLALMARREMGSLAGLAAMALSLLAYEPLRASSHFTGVETAVALLVFSWLAARGDRPILAAALSVAAVLTRLYAIPGVVALVAVELLRNRRQGVRLMAAGAAIGTLAFAALGLWTGFDPMIRDLFLYHAGKTSMDPGELENMKATVLFHNAGPAALFALSLPVMLGALSMAYRRTERNAAMGTRLREAFVRSGIALPAAGAFAAAVLLGVLLNMDRVWMYYFVPAFPFGALAAAWLVSHWARGAHGLVRARGRASILGVSRLAVVGSAGTLAAFVVCLATSHLLERNLAYFERESDKSGDGPDKTYAYREPAHLPDFAEALVRKAFWEDTRDIGEPYSSFTYYLWHESRVFDTANEAVAEIRARTFDGDTLFGDSGTAPLLALLSGRDIAGREVDTNVQRYRSGSADPEELVRKIDVPTTRILFLRRRFGVAGLPQIQALAREKYDLVREFRTDEGPVYQMFQRRAAPRSARHP